jgi:hypothetical protein
MPARARAALVALLGALLLASLAAGSAAAAAPDAGGNLTFAVQLQEDGDARWTVRASFALETDSQRQAFADLAAAYERGETPGLGLETFRNASDAAAVGTGRPMTIRDVTRGSASDATIANGTGWLSLSFTWTNFARIGEDGQLLVDDAFNTSQGTWLSRLGANETLVIVPPSGHNPFTGDCDLTERSFRCTGPMTFGAGSPSWIFTGDGGGGILTPALVVAGLLGLLVVVFVVARRRDGLPRRGDIDELVEGDDEEPGDAPAATAPETDDDAASAAESQVDVELLSDEERVERLLEQNGGRMKQASIVKETGWSNAKVSQLLSSMEEADRIDKLRIGRENLISFPDEDVTDIDE